jgi:hypothetical protein
MSTTRRDSVLWRFAVDPPKLEGGIDMQVELVDDSHGIVRLIQGNVEVALRALGLSVPYPSGLRRLLSAEHDIDLVIADRVPAGLRRAAEEAGLSYLDINGRGRILAPGLVYLALPEPDAAVERSPSSPFAPKSSRVVRTLLSSPRQPWRISDIALLSHLNPGNVHRVLATLVEQGMVERDGDAYLLADPGSLLEAWAYQARPPREQTWAHSEGARLGDLLHGVLEQLEGDAVVSGEFAAEQLAPYLPAETAIVHCLNPDRFARLRSEQRDKLQPSFLQTKQVLIDLADEGYGEFHVMHKHLPLAAPVQVYVDLASDRGRGREAAEHLRRTAIGF